MRTIRLAVLGVLAAALAGCGGGGSGAAGDTHAVSAAPASSSTGTAAAAGSGPGSAPAASHAEATVPLMLASDGASRNWAKVAVRILDVSLTPVGGAAPLSVYTASASAPPINLEQLDRISQLLGTVSIPPGSYSGALITVAANPGDVALTSSDDPRSGFAAASSTPIAPQDIKVQDSQGGAGAMTVAIPVTFPAPYLVNATARVQPPLRLELSLLDPAFVQSQTPVTHDPTLWAVDFKSAASGAPVPNFTSLVLRQMYGTLSSVASDGKSITLTRDYPTEPAVTPETALATPQQLTILADAGNGTEFYDLDTGTGMTVSSFAALAGLTPGRFLRISARYQADGSLVATQIWAADAFSTVWSGPDGHVMRVDAGNGTLQVEDASGKPVEVATDASTEFDYNGAPIATGSAFLSAGPVVRGFKVRVTPRSPNAHPLIAQSIDIESAEFWGAISNSTLTGFTYTSQFSRTSDNYTIALGYISPSTPNGTAADGAGITGYAYWNFAFPSEIVYGEHAAADFQLATGGSLTAYGVSLAAWNDPAAPDTWALRSTTLLPAPLGLATVTSGLVASGSSASFSATPLGSSAPVTVQLITASGSAPLVYSAHRDHGDIRMSPLDITTASGLSQLGAALQPGTYVKVFALPKSSGVVQAYTLLYYTGIDPREAAPSSGQACNGTFTGLFAGTVTVTAGQDCALQSGATVEGNIEVSAGTLELSGAAVKGKIEVQGGGTVSIQPGTLIEGDLQIRGLPPGSAQVEICGASIEGDLRYRDNAAAALVGSAPACAADTIRGSLEVSGNSAPTVISGNQVDGDVRDEDNTAATQVTGNTIGGNLEVMSNTGPSTQVSRNVIGKELQCESNGSISGGGNSARKKHGQCSSL